MTQKTLSAGAFWSGVIVLLLALVVNVVVASQYVFTLSARVDVHDSRLQTLEADQKAAAERREGDAKTLNELVLNIKTFMAANGLKYQTLD